MSEHTFVTIPLDSFVTPYFLLVQIPKPFGLSNPKSQASLGSKASPLHNDTHPSNKTICWLIFVCPRFDT